MEPPYGVEESNNNFIIGEYTQQKQVIENATTEYAFADSEFTRRKVKFFVFFLFSMMCDILNCGVIGVIFQSRKIRYDRKMRNSCTIYA
jgi:ABC-type maltose transport system permease subunit